MCGGGVLPDCLDLVKGMLTSQSNQTPLVDMQSRRLNS